MADPAVLWRGFIEAYNGKDLDAMDSLYADDAVLEFPGRGEIRGRTAINKFMREVQFTACPDATTTLVSQAVRGQTVISEWTDIGVNTGPLMMPNGSSLPPTGKGRAVKGVDVLEADGDLIRAHRFYFDAMSVLVQLGLVPPPARPHREGD